MKPLRLAALLALTLSGLTTSTGILIAAPPAPTPVGPPNGASVTVPLVLSWTAVSDPAGIIGYNYQVSAVADFSRLVHADSTGGNDTDDVVSGLTNGTYFWRVQAANGAGEQGAWSQPQSFTVTGVGPGTPGTPLLNPTQGYSTFHPWESIHFTWSEVPDAVTYRLEVSNDPNFPVGPAAPGVITFWNDNIPRTSDGYVHTMIGNWYARVFAVSADNPQEGIRSLPSNVIEFSCFYDNPIGPPPVLESPLGNPTLTLPVTLKWAHVPNPQSSGYLWEVATDSSFSNVEIFNNQYTNPLAELLSLTPGQKFWRVLSQHGLSSPTTNAVTDWSSTGQFTISSAPAVPVSITPRGGSVVYSGAMGRLIAVQLTAGVPAGGASISISSSHPSVAPVPATISMPGGHAWTQFPITYGQVTSPTVVTLSATLNGVTASNQFTLQPPTLNNEILQSVVRATGGTTMTGWVDLEGGGLAGAGGFSVNLASDSPAASVPATVTIPAGAGGTSFPIQTTAVESTTNVTITASSGGVTTSWTITLTAAPAPTSLLVRPMSTTSGSQGVVTIAEGAGHDQVVQASSSHPSLAAVPSSVSVSAGSGIGFFDIVTAPVTEPTVVTIWVSGGGVSLSHPLTLYPTLPPLSALSVSPTSVVGGSEATGTVTLGGPAPPTGVAINIGSNLPLTASAPKSVVVPSGARSVQFTIKTFPSPGTTVQFSAAMDGVFQFASLSVTAPAPSADLSAVSVNPTSVTGGSSSTGTVTLGAAAPTGGAVISLSDDSSATSVPTSVTVAAGATSANFTITTTSVTTSTISTISAVSGSITRMASLTVNPPPPAAPSLLSPANDAKGVPQPVRLDWSDVANAASYEVQVDDSSTIAAPFVANPTVTVSEAILNAGLPAQRLWWRVRARNSAGVFGPFSATRRFTPATSSTTPTATLSSITLSPSSVVGGNSSTGTVTLTSAAPSGGAVVSLSSSSTTATVPSSVTIAAGATNATFTITTSAVSSSTSATISAAYGGTTRTTMLTITPPGQAATLTVTATGRSGERVLSNPAGINVSVGTTGSASFTTGTSIVLSVTNSRDAIWSGACSSGGNKTKTCTFTLTGNASVTANVQ